MISMKDVLVQTVSGEEYATILCAACPTLHTDDRSFLPKVVRRRSDTVEHGIGSMWAQICTAQSAPSDITGTKLAIASAPCTSPHNENVEVIRQMPSPGTTTILATSRTLASTPRALRSMPGRSKDKPAATNVDLRIR